MWQASLVRISGWVVIALVSSASSILVFTVLGRHQVGTPRPVGTVCDFEHDPGSGPSDVGRVEHRGRLVAHEACVHATDGENIQPVGLTSYAGALVTLVVSAAILTGWSLRRTRAGPVAAAPTPRVRS